MSAPGLLHRWKAQIDTRFGLGCIVALAAMLTGGAVAVDIVGMLLIITSMLGGTYSVLALALCAIVRFLNSTLAPTNSSIGAISWIILILSVLRNFRYIFSVKYFHNIWPIFGLSLWAIIGSIIASAFPLISLLKIISFLMTTTLLIAVMSSVPIKKLAIFKRQMTTAYLTALVASFPFLFIPQIGYALNGRGFQGIFNQSQTFAIYSVPAFSYLMMALFERKKLSLAHAGLALLVAIMLFESKARTAALASGLSVVIAVCYGLFLRIRIVKKVNTSRLLVFSLLGFMTIPSLLIFSDSFREKSMGFIFKYDAKESLDSAFTESRGALVDDQLESFRRSPIVGNGFGVYSGTNRKMDTRNGETLFGIPISAPVEKGVIFTGVLEEMGAVGALLFMLTIFFMIRRASRIRDAALFAMFLGCLFVNFGEAVFFSMNGIGIHFWILMAYVLGTAGRPVTIPTRQHSEALTSAEQPDDSPYSKTNPLRYLNK